jgi:CheY-like chemotaxis protein
MTRRVLVVEDEINLLTATVRGLQSLDGIVVSGCGSAEEALATLTSAVPDLLVLDINLPGVSGLDLLEDLAARGLDLPVIVTTAYRMVNQEHLDRHPGLTILEKPVPLNTLRALVRQHLEPSASDISAGPFQVSDYLQLAGLGRHSLVLEAGLGPGRSGRIEIWRGEIWNAWCDDATGIDALGRMVLGPSSGIRTRTLAARPGARQIDAPSENVLLEIARLHDEAGAGQGEPARPDEQELRPLGQDIEQMFADAISAYLERDLDRALELLRSCQELQPDDHRVCSAIRKIERRRVRT